MFTLISRYLKSITALVTGLIGWSTLVVTSSSDPVTAAEWIALATALAIAGGVYQVPNSAPASKRRRKR